MFGETLHYALDCVFDKSNVFDKYDYGRKIQALEIMRDFSR